MMKEMIQLSFTEEELTILQAFVAVGIMIHLGDEEAAKEEISSCVNGQKQVNLWQIK